MKIRAYRGENFGSIKVRYEGEMCYAPMEDILHWDDAIQVLTLARPFYGYKAASPRDFMPEYLILEVDV